MISLKDVEDAKAKALEARIRIKREAGNALQVLAAILTDTQADTKHRLDAAKTILAYALGYPARQEVDLPNVAQDVKLSPTVASYLARLDLKHEPKA